MISPMRNRRSGVGVIAYRGFVYALGGFNGITRMNSAERYNPETQVWSTIPEMFSPRSNFAVGVRCVDCDRVCVCVCMCVCVSV